VADALTDGQQLVFVGGLHRSGTSLLAELIAAHPQGTGLTGTGAPEDEGQHVQPVYLAARAHGGHGRFARSEAAHLTEASPLATPANATALIRAWSPYWDTDKRYLVEKSPPNLLMGRFLQELFPDARFVFIVRHPVAVTLATRKWRKRMPLPKLLGHWFVAHDIASEDIPYLRNVHLVSYEHLMTEPELTLADVAGFLNMDTPIPRGRINPERASLYADTWQSLIDQGDRGARACIKRYQDAAARYGYDINDLSQAPRRPLGSTT
jgi:Sulfotransferase family